MEKVCTLTQFRLGEGGGGGDTIQGGGLGGRRTENRDHIYYYYRIRSPKTMISMVCGRVIP